MIALHLSRAPSDDHWHLEVLREWVSEVEQAAQEALEMQHLRGLFLGQAAEAESAIVGLAASLSAAASTEGRPRRLTFGSSLAIVRAKLERELPAHEPQPWTWFANLEWLQRRRNQLIHAHLSVGLARQHEHSDLEPVVTSFQEIQGSTNVDWMGAPMANGDTFQVPGEGEIDEDILRQDLWRAWVATCSAAALIRRLVSSPESV